MKNALIYYFIAVMLCLNIFGCRSDDMVVIDDRIVADDPSSPCYDTNCADYTSQAAAQAAFNADPDCRGDLDADNDGIACEEPGNSVTICPTTAACGCSNFNKTACESKVCCRWTVGEGCGCK